MTVSYETKDYDQLRDAIQRANQLNQNVLYSFVKKVDGAEPLSFYHAGRRRYSGKRFYWQNPSGDLILSGLGHEIKIDAESGAARMKQISSRLSEVQKTSIQAGVFNQEGTGCLLFGGFSFDPVKSSGDLWKNFGLGLFYVPSFLLTSWKGQTWLTVNYMCVPGDQSDKVLSEIRKREQEIWNGFERITPQQNLLKKKTEHDPRRWIETVSEAVRQMKTSGLNKIVLARTLRLIFRDPIDTDAVLSQLRRRQKGNFIFSMESEQDCFIGASPERLARKKGKDFYSACLAGSIARGRNEDEDSRLGRELLHDKKNREEHQYVVSTIRQALLDLCTRLYVPDEPVLMKNRDIQHLYTPVRGECAQNVSVFEFINKLHPTPALGGVPTKEAVSWIRSHENLERGFYASPIGWCDTYGNGEFAVGIRSALIHYNEASLFAGCGVLKESDPEEEFKETTIKFRPMLDVLGGIGNGSY
ncbi:isochorismate synthase [Sporolactobacillus sp. THM7-4]|nr:isochorismate synthase [Sporolactobacillus sp. THM7-4]